MHFCALSLLQSFPNAWTGQLILKRDTFPIEMLFICGNEEIAQNSLRSDSNGSKLPLLITERMRWWPSQLEGLQWKIQRNSEHSILLAFPYSREDDDDLLTQNVKMNNVLISYLQERQSAGIAYVKHQHQV